MPNTYADRRAANDKRVADDIHQYGCHVISVFDPEETHPPFSYSVGIFDTSMAPEVIVVGLKVALGGFIVNEYNRKAQSGVLFEPGRLYEGFLDGFSVYFEPARPELLTDYTLGCDRYYHGKAYPTMQILWPSTTGVWPWEPAASDWFKRNQPLLGHQPRCR